MGNQIGIRDGCFETDSTGGRHIRRGLCNPLIIGDKGSLVDDPAAHYERHETHLTLAAAIHQLPDRLRSVMVLRGLQGLTYREISEVLEIQLDSVKVHVHRAHKALRKKLAPVVALSNERQS